MKAKEEYVDAPRETRSKDITVYAIIFLHLLWVKIDVLVYDHDISLRRAVFKIWCGVH